MWTLEIVLQLVTAATTPKQARQQLFLRITIPPRSGPPVTPALEHPEDHRNREPLEGAETPFEKDLVLEIEGVRQE